MGVQAHLVSIYYSSKYKRHILSDSEQIFRRVYLFFCNRNTRKFANKSWALLWEVSGRVVCRFIIWSRGRTESLMLREANNTLQWMATTTHVALCPTWYFILPKLRAFPCAAVCRLRRFHDNVASAAPNVNRLQKVRKEVGMTRGSLNKNPASALNESNEKVVALPTEIWPEHEAAVNFISGIVPTAEVICSSRFRIVNQLWKFKKKSFYKKARVTFIALYLFCLLSTFSVNVTVVQWVER
jgi:hypothetical protein